MAEIKLYPLLVKAQEYIVKNYAQSLLYKEKRQELKNNLAKFLYDTGYSVEGYSTEELVERLVMEMADSSILTPYLTSPDVEEININGWDDIAVTFTDGHIEKTKEHFFNPTYAVDIVRRLLQTSGEIIDNATPIAQGHLPNNTRITAIKTPIVDEEKGIAASIRLLHPQRVDRENLLKTEAITEEMLSFLEMCLRYGVSYVIAGRTSSGKTTLLNSLLGSIPDNKRIYTIESGARELSLVKYDSKGNVLNNVVHTLSRPSEMEKQDVSQEDLVTASLRFDPDVICVGEMRDSEAHSAVEASATDHTVVTTVHGAGGRYAHRRIAFLSQRRFPIDMKISMQQVALAFPIVVFAHKLEDNSRRVMDITECVVKDTGELEYRTLYRYKISKNEYYEGKFHIEGAFKKCNVISDSLKEKLLRGGVPQSILDKFIRTEEKV